jgi:osmotically inducible protein OsmC
MRAFNPSLADRARCTLEEEPMQALYTAEATATGGRQGKVRSSDGVLDLELAIPKQMGGSGAAGHSNPEQLFAAGFAACFQSALFLVARAEKASLGETTVTSRVGIGPDDQGGYGLQAQLSVSIAGLGRDRAEELVARAHQVCPYSKATRGNIEVDLAVV